MFAPTKKRSKFGKFVDKNLIKQNDIAKKAKVSKGVISQLASQKDRTPNYHTAYSIIKALNKMGYPVDFEDFWKV